MVPYLISPILSKFNILVGSLVSNGSGENNYWAPRAYDHGYTAPDYKPAFDGPPYANMEVSFAYKSNYDSTKPVYAIIAGPYASNWGARYRADCPASSNNKMKSFVYLVQDEDEVKQFKAKLITGVYFDTPIAPGEFDSLAVPLYQTPNGLLYLLFDTVRGFDMDISTAGRVHEYFLSNPEDASLAVIEEQLTELSTALHDLTEDVDDVKDDITIIGANVGKTLSTFVSR